MYSYLVNAMKSKQYNLFTNNNENDNDNNNNNK